MTGAMPTPPAASVTGRTVAVTGASGFIGRRIAHQLRSRGWAVRALMRRKEEFPPGTEVVHGALEDKPSLCALVRDVAVVVHCAGAVRATRASGFHVVNALGTQHLVDAVRESGDRPKLVLLSSLAAREPQVSAYAASKREAEQRLAASGLAHCTVRPPAVYGPGDRATLPLVRMLSMPLVVLPGSSRSRFSLIFVDDLAACVAAVVEHPAWNGDVIEPHDGQPGGYGWRDLAAIAGSCFGRRVRPVLLPKWLVSVPALFNQAAAATFGRLPAITLDKLRELYHDDWVCHLPLLGRVDGWQARTGFAEGFEHTVRWYVQHGWMAAPRSFLDTRWGGV